MTPTTRGSPEATRVLVVEDERRLREMLVSAIHEMGFRATGAKSAEEALNVMESESHDIAMLDLNLPGMGGMDLFERIHDRWPRTGVIILTGFGDLEAARSAIHLDVVDFLSKPASLGEIEVALDRARRRRLDPRDENRSKPTSAVRADGPGDGVTARQAGADRTGRTDETGRGREAKPTIVPDEGRTLQDIERRQILEALDRNNGNRAATAAELDISVRTLYYRLAEFQRLGYLPRDRIVDEE